MRRNWQRSGELVRAKGLEPPHLTILVPKTSASTNSATLAWYMTLEANFSYLYYIYWLTNIIKLINYLLIH